MSKGNRVAGLQKPKEKKSILFRIHQIQLIDTLIDNTVDSTSDEEILLRLSVELSADFNASLIYVKVRSKFVINEREFVNIYVHNVFHVDNLEDQVVNKRFVDKGFIRHIGELSVHHIRGINSAILKDTPHKSLVLPFVDLQNIAEEPVETHIIEHK
jgi:hypothetical protein